MYLEIILSIYTQVKFTEIGNLHTTKVFAIFILHIYKVVYNPSQKCFFFYTKYTTFLWI